MSFRWHAPARTDHEAMRRLITETRDCIIAQARITGGIEPRGLKYLPEASDDLRMFGVLWRGWDVGQLAAIFHALHYAHSRNSAVKLEYQWTRLLPTYKKKL